MVQKAIAAAGGPGAPRGGELLSHGALRLLGRPCRRLLVWFEVTVAQVRSRRRVGSRLEWPAPRAVACQWSACLALLEPRYPDACSLCAAARRMAVLGVLLAILAVVRADGKPAAAPPAPAPGETFELPVRFPEHPTDEEDAYLCTAIKLPDQPLKLVGIKATSDQRIVHHMLLFGEARQGRHRGAAVCDCLQAARLHGFVAFRSMLRATCAQMQASHAAVAALATLCSLPGRGSRPLRLLALTLCPCCRCSVPAPGCQVPAQTEEVWNCRMSPVCGTASEGVLYGWGKNAPAVAMPQGAGFSVGPGTGIRSLVLQARPCAAAEGHCWFCKGLAMETGAMQARTCQCLLPLVCSPCCSRLPAVPPAHANSHRCTICTAGPPMTPAASNCA